jgi:hypothetical protein
VAKESLRGEQFDYSDGRLVTPAQRGGDVRIERCHGRTITLGGPPTAENLDARGGLLTWDTGRPGRDYQEEPQHGRIFGYTFATHRRRSWQLPRLSLSFEGAEPTLTGTFGYSTHTRYTVFWIAGRSCRLTPDAPCRTERHSLLAASIR